MTDVRDVAEAVTNIRIPDLPQEELEARFVRIRVLRRDADDGFSFQIVKGGAPDARLGAFKEWSSEVYHKVLARVPVYLQTRQYLGVRCPDTGRVYCRHTRVLRGEGVHARG